MKKKAWLTRILLISIILIFIDSLRGNLINPIVAIVSSTLIMAFSLITGALERRKEVDRIMESQIKLWKYQNLSFDWSNLVNVILLFFAQAKIGGTLKYMILGQGILFLVMLCYNTFIGKFGNQHLLAIEGDSIVNIQHKIEEVDLSKFQLTSKTDDSITLKGRWRTIRIQRKDFMNSDNILETIAGQLEFSKNQKSSNPCN